MSRYRWVLCVVCLIAAGLAGAALLTSAATAQSPQANSTLLEVRLQADGDAVWHVEYRYRIDGENASQAFADLRRRIETNPDRYTERFATDIRESVAAAENSTGREMALSGVSVATSRQAIPQATGSYGTVTYRFEWTNFAVANDTHLRAGDAIRGFYVGPGSELLVTWPDRFEPASPVRPEPDESGPTRAVWEGETTFASNEPVIVLRRVEGDTASADRDGPATATPTATTTTTTTTTATATATPGTTGTQAPAEGGGQSGEGVPWLLTFAGVATLGLVGAGGAVALRRRDDGGESSTEETPAELLSNEEQVIAALEEHGGRMKQQELTDACGWHESKTSKVVTDMREEGTIDVFRLGRENVISLPEETDD